MGRHYTQLSLAERVRIDLWRQEGRSIREIGRRLGRPASTISRELARNGGATKQWKGGYDGERADRLALRRRRWDARYKLARQPHLRALVRDRLAMGWSPEQIAGRLTLDHGCTLISHESIYRFIYHRSAQKDYWHRLLPRHRHRRGRKRRRPSPAALIKNRVCVSTRPAQASSRQQAGHWEADLMLFKTYGQAILVLHERVSRYTVIFRQPDKSATAVLRTISRFFVSVPQHLRKSITFDNGTEFARHVELRRRFGLKTYFCKIHAPWQKGGVENAIGRLRRPLPRKSDLAAIPKRHINQLMKNYNNTPRKNLGFLTPAEIFSLLQNHQMLHFNREPTFLLSQE
jgi:IS30 family transposase